MTKIKFMWPVRVNLKNTTTITLCNIQYTVIRTGIRSMNTGKINYKSLPLS